MDQQPIVTSLVHYIGTDPAGQPQCWAALVTSVDDATAQGRVAVSTFPPPAAGAVPDYAGVAHVDAGQRTVGSWHWPEVTEATPGS